MSSKPGVRRRKGDVCQGPLRLWWQKRSPTALFGSKREFNRVLLRSQVLVNYFSELIRTSIVFVNLVGLDAVGASTIASHSRVPGSTIEVRQQAQKIEIVKMLERTPDELLKSIKTMVN